MQAIDTGYSSDGHSVGSPKQNTVKQRNVAMFIGNGVNAYDSGSTWYQLDMRLDMPVTMIDVADSNKTDLGKYNVIILSDGTYADDNTMTAKLKEWVKKGGTLIAFKRAINYTRRIGLTPNINTVSGDNKNTNTEYSNFNNSRGAQVIGGTIFESEIDLQHPLFFGYNNDKLPVFKKNTQFYKVEDILATPMRYSAHPVMSGYASNENISKASGAAGIVCYGHGAGKVIASVDDPNFRGYWLGGSKLFANMIFFADLIEKGTMMN
jgi:hypothetical protein